MDWRVTRDWTRYRPQARRALGTASAVVGVLGFVWLLRFGISALVADWTTGSSLSDTDWSAVPRPRPRTYDLTLLVPPSLRQIVGGLASETRVRHYDMPVAQARLVCENTARAAGWRRLAEVLPDVDGFRLGADYDDYFVTREGILVHRSYAKESDGTRQEDFEFDIRPVRENAGEMLDVDKLLAHNGLRVHTQLPLVLREILPTGIISSHLVCRNAGASFVVVALTPFDMTASQAQVCAALAKAGWQSVEGVACGWSRENLFAAYSFSPREEGKGTQVFVRISDDELMETTTNGKRQKETT